MMALDLRTVESLWAITKVVRFSTSALDNESERWIQQSLDVLAKDRTTITIAHRLSTIHGADEILVIADNGIAERGTHEELIQKKGIYAHYYEMQFQ